MRNIGIFAWYGYDLPLRARLELIAGAGFRSTCLWLGPEEPLFVDGRQSEMPTLARGCGLAIDNVHVAATGCNAIWTERNGHEVLTRYERAIDFCWEHQIPVAVVHVTEGADPPPMGHVGVKRMRDLSCRAEQSDVIVAIENCRRPDYVDFLLSECDSTNLGFCYDSSHDLLYGRPPTDILLRWGHRLATMHLSDNRGKQDDHFLPGHGVADWAKVMGCLRGDSYRGPLMFEVVPEQIEQVAPREFLASAYRKAVELQDMQPG